MSRAVGASEAGTIDNRHTGARRYCKADLTDTAMLEFFLHTHTK